MQFLACGIKVKLDWLNLMYLAHFEISEHHRRRLFTVISYSLLYERLIGKLILDPNLSFGALVVFKD